MLLETGISKCFWWNIKVLEMRKMLLDIRGWATWVTKVADNLTRLRSTMSTVLCKVGPWVRPDQSLCQDHGEGWSLPLSGPWVRLDQFLCQDHRWGRTTSSVRTVGEVRQQFIEKICVWNMNSVSHLNSQEERQLSTKDLWRALL